MSRVPNDAPSFLELNQGVPLPRELSTFEKVASLKNTNIDTISAGLNLGISAWSTRYLDNFRFKDDPSFVLDEQTINTYAVGVDRDLLPMFARAKSEEHLLAISDHAASVTAARQKIGESGWGGIAGSIVGGLLDPTTAVTMLAGPAVAGNAARLANASRVAKMATAGLVNIGTSAPLNGLQLAVDPTMTQRQFWASVVGDGLYGAGGVASQTSRAYTRAAVGGIAQASGSALTLPFARDHEDRDAILSEMMIGFTIGGIFNTIPVGGVDQLNVELDKAAKKAQVRADVDAAGAFGAELTPEGKAYAEPVIGSVAVNQQLDDLWTIMGTDGETVAAVVPANDPQLEKIIRGGPATQNVPIAPNPAARPDLRPHHFDVSRATTDYTSKGNLFDSQRAFDKVGAELSGRLSMGGMVGQSELPEMRFLGNAMGTDRMAKGNGVGFVGVIAQKESTQKSRSFQVTKILTDEYEAYKKELAATKVKPIPFETFKEQVTFAKRRLAGQENPTILPDDPKTVVAAKKLAIEFAKDYEFAADHNVPGTITVDKAYKMYVEDTASGGPKKMTREEFNQEVVAFKYGRSERAMNKYVQMAADANKHDAGYAPRIGDRVKIAQAEKLMGREDLVTAVTEAIKLEMVPNEGFLFPEIEETRIQKFSTRMANLWIDNISKPDFQRRVAGAMSESDFREFVAKYMPEMSADDTNGIARFLFSDGEGGRPQRLMSRMPMDETYIHDFGNGVTLAIEDLLDNDMERLANGYIQQIYGASAFAEVSRAYNNLFNKNINTPSELIEDIRSRTTQYLKDPENAKHSARELQNVDRIDALVKMTLGHPVFEPETPLGEIGFSLARTAMAINQGLGLSTQIAAVMNVIDVAKALSHPSVAMKPLMQAFPGFKALVDIARKGKLSNDPLMAYMIGIGLGTGKMTGRVSVGTALEEGAVNAMKGYERKARQFAQTMTRFSLAPHIQDAGELIVASAIVQRLANVAESGKPLGKEMATTMTQLGVEPKMQDRILGHMKTKSARAKNGRILDPRQDSWNDPEAARIFNAYVYNQTQQLLNLGDPSLLPKSFQHPAVSTIVQFRKFPARALENKSLPAWQVSRKFAARQFAFDSVVSSIGYMFTTTLAGILGSSWADDEYFEKRLTIENIALAGIGRATWTSLMPMFADIGLALSDNDPMFAGMRTSNVGADNGAMMLAFGNPTFDRAKNVLGSLSVLRAPLDSDYDVSQRNITTASRAFLPNLPYVQNVVRMMVEDLPRESKQQQE